MNNALIVGMNGRVIAMCPETGTELWRTKLGDFLSASSGSNVSILNQNGLIIAGCNGHVYGLNEVTGEVIWHNELPGAGYGSVSLSIDGHSVQFIEQVVVKEVRSDNV
ncbi:hypothetical protein BZG20_05770 [Salinivibrio sp. IB868]|uniref:outer membrane protein assembly factor BamB family protein n=1 Tax=unclassified Salinivibrio TaxID=2636825 RepID=UPI00098732CD|nr:MULTISPECIES: PQQ-binding-like beta-propeller repeat protein [unclassified Salinivibrio]OOE67529.1 hypothetical protein BZG20_05770 [Salinivibrio sp. IB868]